MHRVGAEVDVAVRDEGCGRLQVAVDDRARRARLDPRQRVGGRRHHHVAAEHEVGAAGGDAHGVEVLGPGRDADVAHHRAVLLREAGEVEHRAALAFEMRRHADQRADVIDAGAADAGDQDAVGLVERRAASASARSANGSSSTSSARPLGLARRAAMDRDEARAEALDAGVILVAVALVDLRACGRTRSPAASPRRSSTSPSNRRSLRRRASLMKTRLADRGTCRACGGGASRRRRSGRRPGP